MRSLTFILLLLVLSACTLPQYHDKWISEGSEGEKMRDLRPVPEGSTDLREFALSLPILESRSQGSIDWYYDMSEAAPTQSTWELPTDGAQPPVTVRRLPSLKDGSQQIEIQLHPLESQYDEYYQLQRIKGGWMILKTATIAH